MPSSAPIVYPDVTPVVPAGQSTVPAGYAPVSTAISQEMIEEMGSDVVVGNGTYDAASAMSGVNAPDNEPLIRKRIVKIVGGKVVDQRVAYLKKVIVDPTYGAGYAILSPLADPLSGTATFTPITVTLP